jgi:hypothetical protein
VPVKLLYLPAIVPVFNTTPNIISERGTAEKNIYNSYQKQKKCDNISTNQNESGRGNSKETAGTIENASKNKAALEQKAKEDDDRRSHRSKGGDREKKS